MNVVPRCPTAPVKCLCAKEQKEIQEAALEAPAGAMQRVLMGPAWFLSRCLSQSRQFVGFRLPPKKHDKQAATRIHAQTLQAGAVACERELGQRGGAASCKMGAREILTHGRWSVSAQSWSATVVSRPRRDFREP